MKYMLDTHTLIWLLEGNPKLSDCAKEIISDIDNQLLVSSASLWEMTIKMSIGKLRMIKNIGEIANELTLLDIQLLQILPSHLQVLETLPFHHNDPFDRIIIAQSISEKTPIIGLDAVFEKYGIALVW